MFYEKLLLAYHNWKRTPGYEDPGPDLFEYVRSKQESPQKRRKKFALLFLLFALPYPFLLFVGYGIGASTENHLKRQATVTFEDGTEATGTLLSMDKGGLFLQTQDDRLQRILPSPAHRLRFRRRPLRTTPL